MNSELYDNLKRQIEDNWLQPEIEKRGFTQPVFAILAVFKPEGTEVLLNGETNLILEVQATNNSTISDGGKITIEQLNLYAVRSIKVTEEIFYNYGYIAAVIVNENWHIKFDFIPQKKELKEKIEIAEDFVKAAEAVTHEKVKAYNLYQAVEQATQSVLFMNAHHKDIIQKAKKHNATKTLVNQELQMGNMPKEVVNLYNRLLNERPKIYTQQSLSITLTDENIFVIKNYIQSYKKLFTY